MGTKGRPIGTDSPRAEVGEIDTRAPFESVKAAVSLFGEVAFSSDRSSSSAIRKPKLPQSERVLAKETELHLAQKELNKYKEQLNNAEMTRVQALAELDRAKKTVEELTLRLNQINTSKDLALKATEAAKTQTKLLEEQGAGLDNSSSTGSLKLEMEAAREQYVAALADLDAAKLELRKLKKEFDTSLEAKLFASQQEADARQLSEANTEKAAELSKEISAMQESLSHVRSATEQAQLEESNIRSEKDAARQSYKQAMEENTNKLAALKQEFDPAALQSMEGKLEETNAEIETVRKKMEDARTADLESVTAVNTELDEARQILSKLAEEEGSLRGLVESLKEELEGVKKEHGLLKAKDAETEAVIGDLHLKLQKCKAELEAAATAESRATTSSDELLLALQQLSSESKTALQEVDVMKKSAEELKQEAEVARLALADAEKKLQSALKDAEDAKMAETQALERIKELSDKTNAARASTSSESGASAKISISKEEFESLSHKVEESERLSQMKVAAAMAQVDAVRASENEAIKRLEAARKEMEEMEAATEDALKRAEMAEAAKKAVEGELRRWREREQKRTAEAAARILAEPNQQTTTTTTVAPSPPRPRAPPPSSGNAGDNKGDAYHHQYKESKMGGGSKKSLLPTLSGIFHHGKKKNNHVNVDAASPSFLPGERLS